MTGEEALRPAHVELGIHFSVCETGLQPCLRTELIPGASCTQHGTGPQVSPSRPLCPGKASVRPRRNKARDVLCINVYETLHASTVS